MHLVSSECTARPDAVKQPRTLKTSIGNHCSRHGLVPGVLGGEEDQDREILGDIDEAMINMFLDEDD